MSVLSDIMLGQSEERIYTPEVDRLNKIFRYNTMSTAFSTLIGVKVAGFKGGMIGALVSLFVIAPIIDKSVK